MSTPNVYRLSSGYTTWWGNCTPNNQSNYYEDDGWAVFQRMVNAGHGTLVRVATNIPCGSDLVDEYQMQMGTSEWNAALIADQPYQIYNGQTVGASTGYADPSTGAGISSAAPPFNSGPSAPPYCVLQSGALVCGGSINPAGGPISIPGLLSDPGFANANTNQLRCSTDPLNWACPTVDVDGTDWATTGGPKITIPDCYGLTVDECEAEINTALTVAGSSTTAAFTTITAPTYDPNLADGLVSATIAAANAIADASSVTMELNQSQPNDRACEGKIDNYHKSKTVGHMLSYVYADKCTFTSPPDVLLSAKAWACTSQPTPNATLLDSGAYGCQPDAEMTDAPVSVVTGQRSSPVYLNGPSYDPTKWYISMVYSTGSDPQVSVGYSQAVPPGTFG